MLIIIPKPPPADIRRSFEADERWFTEQPHRNWRLRELVNDEGLAIADLREGCESLAAWVVVARPLPADAHAGYSRWFGLARNADLPSGTDDDADDARVHRWLTSQMPTCNMRTAWAGDFAH